MRVLETEFTRDKMGKEYVQHWGVMVEGRPAIWDPHQTKGVLECMTLSRLKGITAPTRPGAATNTR